jgi:CRP/FNR family transcriptional regulator, anaerobic regulatory protein
MSDLSAAETTDLLRRLVPGLRLDEPRLAAEVARTGARVARERGTLMFDEGATCPGLLLLEDGTVRVSRVSADGRELLLYRVRPGETCVLTVSCLLGRGRYPARGVAEEPVRGVLLPAAVFERLIDAEPAFRDFVFRSFSERIGGLLELATAVAFERLDRRLAAALLAGVERSGSIDLAVTHQALADELGTVRERVSRLLEGFEAAGAVELGRGHVVVRDKDALVRRAAGAA